RCPPTSIALRPKLNPCTIVCAEIECNFSASNLPHGYGHVANDGGYCNHRRWLHGRGHRISSRPTQRRKNRTPRTRKISSDGVNRAQRRRRALSVFHPRQHPALHLFPRHHPTLPGNFRRLGGLPPARLSLSTHHARRSRAL